jgi:hypothetical protein
VTDKTTWSPQAHRNAKISASASAGFELDARRWAKGPRLEDHKIVIPSAYYNAEIAAFFKAQGFIYDPDAREWWRDTRRPHKGKIYTPDAWLQAARRKFDEIWNRKEKTQ